MRAAVLSEIGGVPEETEFDDPTGGHGGELIDVTVAGLNPVDLFIATGNMPRVKPEPPCVVGLEGVGTRASDGRRVYFFGSAAPFGSFAERTITDPETIVEIPEGVEDATALCFGIAGMAGWLALEWRAQLRAGECVLVLGATGVVGRVAVQAAKLLGAGRVIAAARSEEALADVAELGADATVRITEDGFADALRETAPEGIDVIIDPIWGPAAMASLQAAGMSGRLIQIGNASGPQAELVAPAFRNKQISIMGFTNFAVPADVRAEAFTRMCRHAAAGELQVETEEFALTDVGAAWKRQAEGPHHKLVIRV